MQLSSFLELTADLNQNYALYYRLRKTDTFLPITKITLDSTDCLFYTSQDTPRKLTSIQKILHQIHQTNINLSVIYNNKKTAIYGVQIDLANSRIYLV